jgi:TonB family protein
MLKQPLPGRARSALGFGIAAALAVGGSYAAWAAQPATPPAVPLAVAAGSAQAESNNAGATNPVDSKAIYRSMRRIVYPAAQIAAKVEGVVYVKVHVAADGTLTSAIADRVDPASAVELAGAAIAGVRTWRFNPAQKAGNSVASDEIIPIVFSLRPDAVPKVTPGTLDAIRVSPPDEPGVASADRPPTEDVTFRDMHPPQYPPEAVQQKQSGNLVFKVLVDEHGAPQSVDVEKSDPPEAARLFTQASIEAIMQWRFNPGIKDGKPYAGYVVVPITFALDD